MKNWLPFLSVALGAIGCRTLPVGSSDFDWTIGTWRGVRRDAADGSEAPMTLRVERLATGIGQLRVLAVTPAGGATYRGAAVVLFDADAGRWVWQYTNAPERAFARYVGPPGARGELARSEWRSVSPGRTRESRLVSERLPDGRWRRSMSTAPLGEDSWQPLWTDELVRDPDPD